MFDTAGRQVGVRVRAHPALAPLRHLDEQLGYTAEQLRITPRSQRTGGRDEAIATALRRDARLRAASKTGLPEPDLELLAENADAEKPH